MRWANAVHRTAIGTSVGASLGLGYLRTYVTGPEFVFANGSYHRRPDTGNGRMMPSFSLEIGQHLRKEHYAPQLFVRYQTWLEYPYSPGFIELMSHTSLHMGYRFPAALHAPTSPPLQHHEEVCGHCLIDPVRTGAGLPQGRIPHGGGLQLLGLGGQQRAAPKGHGVGQHLVGHEASRGRSLRRYDAERTG